jgi:hypothetical protein
MSVPTRESRHNQVVPLEIRQLYFRISEVDGLAMAWRLGEPVTFCVISRSRVNPKWHRVIDDIALRDEARRLITKYRLPMSNSDDPDTVLILAPAV